MKSDENLKIEALVITKKNGQEYIKDRTSASYVY